MSTFTKRYSGAALALVAVAISGFAVVRWASLLGDEPQAVAATSDTRAWALLSRALKANNQVPFSARVDTVVFVGARGLQSEARLVSAPDHLAIDYLSGPLKGQQSGYSDQWFWRQNASGKLAPYAQSAARPEVIAERRFELMRANYQARLQGPGEVDGRPVEVIELRPARPLYGTNGPARRVFVDDATGLILRTEAFNSRLQPVSHSNFSNLDLRPTATATAFHAPAAILAAANQSFWQGEEWGDDERGVAAKIGIAPPQSQYLPRGWTRDGFGIHRCDQSAKTLQVAAFTRYTDGLNVLTLFAIKTHDTSESVSKSIRCSFGPSTLVSRTDGEGTLVAIGDLPPEILRRVLNDARFQQVAVSLPTPAAVTPAPAAVTPAPAAVTPAPLSGQ